MWGLASAFCAADLPSTDTRCIDIDFRRLWSLAAWACQGLPLQSLPAACLARWPDKVGAVV